MLTQADRNRIAVNLWTARIIPLVLAGVVGYATYVTVALLCVNYLLVKHDDKGAAIPILVFYFILFTLMTVAFIRLLLVTVFDPPYVPLGAAALRDRKGYNKKGKRKAKLGSEEKGIGTGEYDARDNSGGTSPEFPGPSNDPDSPGLELFYTKDVFVSEGDGRPIWCSQCSTWKLDRTHHDSSSGRCIKKMDHFCPWVGGPVGENNFKFFIQFNAYTALYCFHLLVVMAIYIRQEITTKGESVNQHFCAILALATFFGLFTAGMTGTSLELAANNTTQVERLGGKTKVHFLAVLKPPTEQLRQNKPSSAPEVAYREITYPLNAGFQVNDSLANRNSSRSERNHPSTIMPTQNLSIASMPPPSGQPVANDLAGLQDSTLLASRDFAAYEPKPVQLQPSSNQSPVMQDLTSLVTLRQSNSSSHGNGRAEESLSARDLQATRTFAVLKMQPGENPWDLESARLNLQTVMGSSVLDWLLPIRRSPCSNHEDAESQFRLGPKVDLLRASCYFVTAHDMRLPEKIEKESEGNPKTGAPTST